MSREIKKNSCRFAVLIIILAAWCVFPETSPGELEARLSKTQGIEKIKVLEELTRAYRKSDPRKSIMFGREALELLRDYPDPKLRLTILNTMSNSYRLAGDNRDAEDYAQSSLNIAREINDKAGIAAAIFSLGRVYHHVGVFDQAMENYSQSLELFKELNKQTEKAEVLNMIGFMRQQKGEYASAVEYYFKSLKIYEDTNDRKGIGYLTNNIGIIYWDLKNYDKSLDYFLKALKIKENIGDKLDIALAINNVGAIYMEKRMYPKALDHYNRSLQLSQGTGNKIMLSMLYKKIGICYRALKNYPLALDYFSSALAITEEYKEKTGIAENSVNVASVYQLTGKYEEAIRLAGQGLDIALKLGLKDATREAYRVLSDTYQSLGGFQQALLFHKRFREINDTLLNDDTTKKILGLQIAFDVEKEQKRIEFLEIERKNQRAILYYLIFAILLVMGLTALIFTRFRLKSRLSKELAKENDEHRKTEAKLRESEEQFRVLSEKSVLGIRIIQDNVIAYANPRAAEIFAFSPGEMPGRDPIELAIEEDRSLLAQKLADGLAGVPLDYEYRGLTWDMEIIHLESFGTAILYQGRPALLESFLDISHRKAAEAELIKTRKMEAVGLMAGGIAHDFNNLLAIIMGNNSMMKMRGSHLDPSLIGYMENIEKASIQGSELSQKFLTFSQGGWMMRNKATLPDILKGMPFFIPTVQAIPYKPSIPGDLYPIYGDDRQLRQVFANLLINALEATANKNHREITLIAKNLTLGNGNPFSLAAGKYIQVSVSDNGTGIDDEAREKIFEPFFTTKNTVGQKGLGLGMTICFSIIKKHDGHITVDSEPGQGTTINVYIPAYAGQ